MVTGLDQVTSVDHGFIWRLGQVRSFGFVKTVGEAQAKATNAWVGEGKITIFSKQKGANFYKWITDGKVRSFQVLGTVDVTFSPSPSGRGILPLQGNCSEVWIPSVFPGSGSLKKFSGAAESLTFNPLEKQMLFSFVGERISEKHTESYIGSGRIRNLATLEAEKGSFDYVGSGVIKLLPRKPEVYQLSELANFTLDNYTLVNEFINLGYIQNYTDYTNLADAGLGWLSYETGHEKNTDAYNNSACEDGIELDYGFIINQSANLSCIAVSGTISTNTTALSGCTKVVPGTTLAIAPSATYTIPLSNTTPTSTEDFGLVSEPNAPEARDYGWILDSLSKVCPYGAFDITGTAKTHYVENIISDGGLRLFGEADSFWTPPYYGNVFSRFNGAVHQSFTPAPHIGDCLLYTSPSPRDVEESRMPSSA